MKDSIMMLIDDINKSNGPEEAQEAVKKYKAREELIPMRAKLKASVDGVGISDDGVINIIKKAEKEK